MKKSNSIIALVIIIIVVVGVFAIFHKSKTPATNSSKTSAAAVNNAVLKTKTNASIGQYLVGATGGALYTYGNDTSGKSTCTGQCLTIWPAYVDTGSTTGLPKGVGVIKRTDNGQEQYTYNGHPLYYFASDGAGQVTGNGESNFSVAVPGLAAAKAASSAPTTQHATTKAPTVNPSTNY
jgi:predicted lipoprotein with Yx(FWY)xxD motif